MKSWNNNVDAAIYNRLTNANALDAVQNSGELYV